MGYILMGPWTSCTTLEQCHCILCKKLWRHCAVRVWSGGNFQACLQMVLMSQEI